MRLYGLIGYPLGHSFSARYFAGKFAAERIADCEYRNFPLENISGLPAMIAANPDLQGFNVTIPYKQEIIPFLRRIDGEARAIGAVNCVSVVRYVDAVELAGYNTDAYGFRRSLLGLIGDDRPAALVLGTGGSSRAVKYVLEGLGIAFRNVSRTAIGGNLSYAQLTPEIISQHKLIVNCTPLGTFPNVEECTDLPYEAIGQGHYLFDLVYNPSLTEFLRRGATNGARIRNGYEMLVWQAERSWEIWNGPASAGRNEG